MLEITLLEAINSASKLRLFVESNAKFNIAVLNADIDGRTHCFRNVNADVIMHHIEARFALTRTIHHWDRDGWTNEYEPLTLETLEDM